MSAMQRFADDARTKVDEPGDQIKDTVSGVDPTGTLTEGDSVTLGYWGYWDTASPTPEPLEPPETPSTSSTPVVPSTSTTPPHPPLPEETATHHEY